jgi:DNA invertase Pin-like site-specific DNA recombinase
VQREACLALPTVKGCEQVEVFEDIGISGGKLKGRKAFHRLVERINAADVAVVAAYDQSPAFRNTLDALNFYALMENRPEIEVAFVHGHFDRSPVGGFSYSVLAAAHEMERRMNGEKIKAAKRRASALGLPVGEAPVGAIRREARS